MHGVRSMNRLEMNPALFCWTNSYFLCENKTGLGYRPYGERRPVPIYTHTHISTQHRSRLCRMGATAFRCHQRDPLSKIPCKGMATSIAPIPGCSHLPTSFPRMATLLAMMSVRNTPDELPLEAPPMARYKPVICEGGRHVIVVATIK